MTTTKHAFASIMLLLSSAILIGCSPIGNKHIFGGNLPSSGQFPFVVSIRVKIGESERNLCGSSIVADRFILTAADCYSSSYPSTVYRVVVGGLSIVDGKAYIELATSIQFTGDVAPIELGRDYMIGDEKSIITGWGITRDHINYYLNYVEVYTITNEECKEVFPFKSIEYTLCAFGEWGTGASDGDLGGPLIHDNKLIGVILWDSGSVGDPDGYVRISKYVDWIENTMNA